MARQVLPIVGAVVGTFFGNPQLGFAIGSIVGNAVDPLRIKGPRLNEIPSQTAGEGGYRQVVYGTCWINTTNVIDFGDVVRVKVKERQGKGGGPIVENERLHRTYAIGLGEPLTAIRMIRRNGKIVYDVRPGSAMLKESEAFAKRFKFYTGAETQLPDPDLEALPKNGVGNTPAYRGTAYLVFKNDDLTDLQGQIPTYEVEGVRNVTAVTQSSASLIIPGGIYSGPFGSMTGALGGRDVVDGIDQAFSVTPDGVYLAGGRETFPFFGWWKYNVGTGQYVKLANPTGLPTTGSVRYTAWDESGTYLSILSSATSGAERLLVFKRAGDTLTKLPFSGTWDTTVGSSSGLCITNKNGLRAAYTSPLGQLVMHNIVGDVIGPPIYSTHVAEPTLTLQFSPQSGFILQGWNPVRVWDVRSPTQPATLFGSATVDGTRGAVFSPNGGFVYAFSLTRISVYAFNEAALLGGALTFVRTIDMPAGVSIKEGKVVGKTHLALAIAGGPMGQPNYLLSILAADNGQLTPLAQQPTIAGLGGTSQTLAAPALSSSAMIAAGAVELSAIAADIASRCGLPVAKVDFTALTDTVAGVTLGGPYDGAGAISTMMPAYFFGLFEADRKLRAVKRGAAAAATLTSANLIDEPDENMLRGQDIEYPRALMLKYLNPAQNYAAPAAVVSRTSPDIRVRGEATAELSISLTETEALRVADRVLKVMWEDLGGEVTFSVPSGPYAWLTPTDVLGLSLRGGLYRIRVETVEESGGVLKITARRDRQSAYTSTLTALPLPAPTTPPSTIPGDVIFHFLNLPAISDTDDVLGYRFAATGTAAGYAGMVLQRRLSTAVDYDTVASRVERSVTGRLLDAIPASSEFGVDTTNRVRVQLNNPTQVIDGLTQIQFLQEGGGFAVLRHDGTAELMQYRTVVDEGAGVFALSYLARGRGNTGATAHFAGAGFVLLSSTQLVTTPFSLLGATLVHRPVSVGASPELAETYTHAFTTPNIQREMPVAQLRGTRSGANVLSILWSERRRFGTSRNPIRSTNWLGYRVTLIGSATVVLPDQTAQNATYDASALGAGVTVRVQQINRITGLGPAKEIVL